MNTIRTILVLVVLTTYYQLNAQTIKGQLKLNGKSKTELNLETNSAVQLFKEFKTGKYQLKFSFDGKDLPTNIYKEKIVFFEFKTTVNRNGKTIKTVIRKQPIPYFPGDMFISAEAFDFISVLAVTSWDDMKRKSELIGVMPEGKYSIRLSVEPMNIKGDISPVEFSFILRKRPGRTKY